ncbi:hypothetical protein COX74_01305 [bacterium (Candidatus Gribaldobacteria) CG_4_10_14_0_2_um_filter_41_16]|uniref:Uncharacterized protein n=2 Tax=Candidatus Gribaldobacteria TaxID=2798536 RepID=A0A2M7VJ74_9BACT|nr:MAG: hypothetical protein COU03_01025 [bacterium (Candidatus Gribaldobacteria) CG10_big_fil_rev_8_21_14_0_10_41_12]PJA01709.1 MAG: hypothetical protein COX74_01305 [bacterium (Candidatus Gribaldobacteria) CG_4_10_14_0_2_um_filter_41_16]
MLLNCSKKSFMPKAILDKLPTFELSLAGEAMLQEALSDVKAGRVKKFDNIKDLISDLHKITDVNWQTRHLGKVSNYF